MRPGWLALLAWQGSFLSRGVVVAGSHTAQGFVTTAAGRAWQGEDAAVQ